MHIAWYITGHGYGHAIRSATIAQNLSPDVGITFVTSVPERFFKEELTRPFNYRCERFDCGCVQHDGVTVDIAATLALYGDIARRNCLLLEREIAWYCSASIDGIVSDTVPFAFGAAKGASLPSVAVTNFTWYDVYSEYAGAAAGFEELLAGMRRQYEQASLLLRLYPALPMEYFPVRIGSPVVGRRGRPVRREIAEEFGIDPGKRIALIYAGNFGLGSAPWERLGSMRSWEFFGLYDLAGAPQNYHLISKNRWYYPDLIASADCVVAKPGYGVVSECMINQTPLVYLPRENFAEYQALEEGLEAWGAGVRLSAEEFTNLDWTEALERASNISPRSVSDHGAKFCANTIERHFKR